MMATAESWLSAGVWVAIYPIGSLVLAATRWAPGETGRLAAIVAALACGSAAWSVLLLAAVVANQFHPPVLGASGWVLAAAWAWYRWRRRRVQTPAFAAAPRAESVIVLLILALAGTLYAGWPKESLLAQRDEAIYTLHAMHLLRTGEDRIDMSALGIFDSATRQAMVTDKALQLPGIYPTGDRWSFQFSALPSAWMAQLTATIGDAGLFRLNAILSLLSGLALLALLREWLPRGGGAWPLAALAVFAFNPAQVWVSRVNLSEPMAQWFTLSGLLLASLALRRRATPLALVAGLVLGCAMLVRIDMLVTLLLVALAYPASRLLWRDERTDSRPWFALGAGMGLMVVVAAVYYATSVGTYWSDLAYYVQPLIWAALAMCAAYVLMSSRVVPLPSSRWLHAGATVAIAMIVGAFAYAAFIRPYFGPYKLIESHFVPSLVGKRDFRELSLHNLAAYLSWPLLVVSLAGAVLLLRQLAARIADPFSLVLCSVVLGTSIVFLWSPMVSPDHVWASRRFVPTVIPGAILLATWLMAAGRQPPPERRETWLAALLGVALVTHLLWAQRATLTVAEDRGLLAVLRQLDESVPAGETLFVHGSAPLAATLIAGFGRTALPALDSDWKTMSATLNDIALRCHSDHPCRWLDSSGQARHGLELGPGTDLELPLLRIAGTTQALAKTIQAEQWPLHVSLLTGLRSDVSRRLGGHRDWRHPDQGFFAEEFGPAGPLRWTQGDAMLVSPALPSRAIEVVLHVPSGGSNIRLSTNDQEVFAGKVPEGRWRHEFKPPAADSAGKWRFHIESDTFRPEARWNDPRTLGVKLESIRMLAPEPAPSWTAGMPFSAALSLEGPAAASPGLPRQRIVRVRNNGRWSWPVPGDQRDGENPVQLGILWVARGDSPAGKRLLEQRLALPYRLEPDEELLLPLTLDPGLGGITQLPAADYDVIVSPVLEGVAWFHDQGVEPLRIPVDAREFP